MRSHWLGAGVIGLVAQIAGVAFAADLPANAPIDKAVPAAVYNWTGFYVGGLAGYGSGTGQHCATGFGCPPGFPITDPKGWNAGVTLGYNWQWANWVLGIEGDWSWANMKGHSGDTAIFGCVSSCDTKIKSFETLRGRVGYAFDRFLPYVTAGVAWTQLEASIGSPVISSASTTKTSFVVGGGLEYAFWQNLSAKIEYLYISKLGDLTYDNRVCFPHSCYAHVGAINEVRLGLNWRFTGL